MCTRSYLLQKLSWCPNSGGGTRRYCIVLYCIVLYCIVLYCIVLYCIVLYCIVLYCIVLYCIVSCHVVSNHILFSCTVLYHVMSVRLGSTSTCHKAGWLVDWFGVNGPLRQCFSISARLLERGRKKERYDRPEKNSKQPHPHLLQAQ